MFNLADFIHTVPLKAITTSTGTWATPFSSGIQYLSKSAASETTTVFIPIEPPRRSDMSGVQINTINVPIRVATDSLTSAITATLFRINDNAAIASGTGNVVATALTTTDNASTLGTGIDADDRLLTVTVSTPSLDYSVDDAITYSLVLTVVALTATSLRVYSPKVYFNGLT